MEIVIFSAQYPPHMGGIENFTARLAGALSSMGHSVTVVTNDTNGVGTGVADEGGVSVLRLPCIPLFAGRLPLPLPGYGRMLSDAMRGKTIGGVLINARFYPHSLAGMRLARRRGLIPIVLEHGSAYLTFNNDAVDVLVRAYEHVITAIGRALYKPRYYGVSSKCVEWLCTYGIKGWGVINNSVDADAYLASASNRDFRSELDIAQDDLLVCFVGRLIKEKGIPQLLEAAADARMRERNVKFVLAGDGPLADEVRESVGDNVRWVGSLGQSDVAALLAQADLLCLPTRSEGFSTTLLEASACACPSVVTDVGGAREMIPDDSFGRIIESQDAERIVSAICELSADRNVLARMGLSCQKNVRDNFSWKATARLLVDAFELGGE